MKRIFIKAAALLIFLQSQMSFADPGLFFNVNASGSVLNLTTTIPHHTYPHAGIKFNTPGYSLTSCQPAGNGFCLFSVSDTMPASLIVSGQKGISNATLCLQGQGPLSCQQYDISLTSSSAPRFLYAADSSVQGLIQCSLDSTGAITSCTTLPIPDFPTDVAFNASGTFAYATSGSGVYLCNVDSATGNISNCALTGSGLNDSLAITLNSANTFAYVTNSSQVFECSVNQTTGALSNCATTGSGFSSPNGITLNPSGTFAYIGDLTSLCQVNTVTGALTSCGSASNFPLNAIWFAISPLNTTAYVVNGGSSVLQCRIYQPTGVFPGCVATGDFPFSGAFGIAINSAGTTVYVTDSFNSVVKCSVDATTGALTGCAVTGPAFGNLFAIALYS